MNTTAFDAATRGAANGVSRRDALGTLAGAGLTAVFARSDSAVAKKKGNKGNKGKKKAVAKCQSQAGQCVAFVEDFCPHQACEDSLEHMLFCCDAFLAKCDARGFLECIEP